MQNFEQLYRLDCTSNVIRTFINKLISDLCYFNLCISNLIFSVVFLHFVVSFKFKICVNCSLRPDVIAIHYPAFKNSHYFLKCVQNNLTSSFSYLISCQIYFSYFIIMVDQQISDVLCANICYFISSEVQFIYHVFVFQKFTQSKAIFISQALTLNMDYCGIVDSPAFHNGVKILRYGSLLIENNFLTLSQETCIELFLRFSSVCVDRRLVLTERSLKDVGFQMILNSLV